MANKTLILVRGLPGAGKSTLAHLFGVDVFEADDYFVGADGVYRFNADELPNAHRQCIDRTRAAMHRDEPKIVVANTFTRTWEMTHYQTMASLYGYDVHYVIVENRHNGKSIHNVPDDVVEKMRNRFSVRL